MAAVKARDTKPELFVRRVIHRAGFRYRLHARDLPGRPDLVFPRHRVVVFVHGCFWHGHGCTASNLPASNTAYWRMKQTRNAERHERTARALRVEGWVVVVLWECELATGTDALLALLRRMRAESEGDLEP